MARNSGSDTFYSDLIHLATTPSEPHFESTVHDELKSLFAYHCDVIKYDQEGNLYIFREGAKDGTIGFSAHQDKISSTHSVGYIVPEIQGLDTNVIFKTEEPFSTMGQIWKQQDKGYIKPEFNLDLLTLGAPIRIPMPPTGYNYNSYGTYPKRTNVNNSDCKGLWNGTVGAVGRKVKDLFYDEYGLDEEGFFEDLDLDIPVETPKDYLKTVSVYQGLQCIPRIDPEETTQYTELISMVPTVHVEGGLVGKLDDTLGLSLILDAFRNTSKENSPNLFAVLTTNEERGMTGSTFATRIIGKYDWAKPDKMIVLDVTSAKKPGEGLVLYSGCGGMGPKYGAATTTTTPVNRATTHGNSNLRNADRKHRHDSAKEATLKRASAAAKTVTSKTLVTPVPGMGSVQFQLPKIKEEPLIKDIRVFAKKQGIPLHVCPAHSNDSRVFGSKTKVPTTALEIPVMSMHSEKEKAATNDIELARSLLKRYIER